VLRKIDSSLLGYFLSSFYYSNKKAASSFFTKNMRVQPDSNSSQNDTPKAINYQAFSLNAFELSKCTLPLELCTHLRSLFMTCTNLTTLTLQQISDESKGRVVLVAMLSALQNSSNFMPNLKRIDLSRSKFTEIVPELSECLSKLTNLESIDLTSIFLADAGLLELSALYLAKSQPEKLKELNLSYNKLHEIESGYNLG